MIQNYNIWLSDVEKTNDYTESMDEKGYSFVIMVKGKAKLVNGLIIMALIIRNRIYNCLKDKMKSMDKRPNYMTVPAALRELEKIEMVRLTDTKYHLDHAVTLTQSTDIKIEKLYLAKGQNFSLHYDYGDDWMFTIHVQKIEEGKAADTNRLIKSKGTVEQYSSWDEWEESDGDDGI